MERANEEERARLEGVVQDKKRVVREAISRLEKRRRDRQQLDKDVKALQDAIDEIHASQSGTEKERRGHERKAAIEKLEKEVYKQSAGLNY